METVRSTIDHFAETQPDSVFLVATETNYELRYLSLCELSKRISEKLDGLEIEKGEKVAFLMNNGLWTTLLFLGTMYSGRTILPLNAVSGEANLEYVIDHSDASLLFIEDEFMQKFPGLVAKLPAHVRVIVTSRDSGPQWPDTDRPKASKSIPLAADDDALLIYTSGTTGRPKGVLHSHRSVIAGGKNTAYAHNLTSADRALCVLQLYHINGEMVTVMGPLVSGGSVVMPAKFSATEFWNLIDTWNCSWFSVVPTIIAYLLEQAERLGESPCNADDRPNLHFGRSASAPLSPDMHRQFEKQFAVQIVETMGLTETAAQILSNPMPPAKPKYGSPGFAVGNEAMILGKHGKEQPRGTSGELMIRGSNLMKEYYKNPEATREALTEDGWLRTGDLAYQDSDGYFFITGRLKEIIIKGGENIAPREIDETLYQHNAVLEAAAFPIPDKAYGQEIYASVALKPGFECSAEELREFCIERLGKFKAPLVISFLDELPKGPSGKIQRRILAEAAQQVGEQEPGSG
ncbi:MAG: AMP-binding protein [Gammaproteobacteria bacterium]|nr:AMP-binding protein [Gammaproteobacteria bacterium]